MFSHFISKMSADGEIKYWFSYKTAIFITCLRWIVKPEASFSKLLIGGKGHYNDLYLKI